MSFIFGGNTGLSYEEMIRMRELADALGLSARDNTPDNVGEGLQAVAQAFASRALRNRAGKAEAAGKKEADALWNSVWSQRYASPGGATNASYTPEGATMAPARQGSGQAAAVTPDMPGAIADDTMAALGKPKQPAPPAESWLQYANQGATRDDPLAPDLVSAMSFLPELGVRMQVVSGGQEPAGTPGGKRTGSTRHDHGNAADVDFYKDGRKLDWNNPDDLPLLTTIVRNAKTAGVTGIGAGDDYMGAGRFHVGFGAPAVWGAGGKSANAPAWLVEAYTGAPAAQPPALPDNTRTADASAGLRGPNGNTGLMGVDPVLLQAWQNPYMNDQQRSMLGMLIEEQIKRNQPPDPMADLEYQRAQLGLQRDQLELERMQNPQAAVPAQVTEREMLAERAGLQPGTPEYQVYMATGELPKPGGGTEYGLTPIYGRDEQGNVTVAQIGKDGTAVVTRLPEGFTPDLGVNAYERSFGAAQGKAVAESGAMLPAARGMASMISEQITSLANDPYLPRMLGPVDSRMPNVSEDAARVQGKMDQIQGGAFLQARQLLKGGGAITDFESQRAEAAFARLNAAQSVEDYQAALMEFNQAVQMGVTKLEQAAQAGTYSAAPQLPPANQPAPANPAAPIRRKFNPETGQIE